MRLLKKFGDALMLALALVVLVVCRAIVRLVEAVQRYERNRKNKAKIIDIKIDERPDMCFIKQITATISHNEKRYVFVRYWDTSPNIIILSNMLIVAKTEKKALTIFRKKLKKAIKKI